jgi:ribosomal protein L37AE/L43A
MIGVGLLVVSGAFMITIVWLVLKIIECNHLEDALLSCTERERRRLDVCEHDWKDATDGREIRSFWRCAKCGATFDGCSENVEAMVWVWTKVGMRAAGWMVNGITSRNADGMSAPGAGPGSTGYVTVRDVERLLYRKSA